MGNLITDDIDGTTGAKTRHFSVGAASYEIDLNDAHWLDFLKRIDPYRCRARIAPTKKAKRVNPVPVSNPDDRAAIRAWAIASGRYIAARGRLPQDVIRDYYATQAKDPQEFILAR